MSKNEKFDTFVRYTVSTQGKCYIRVKPRLRNMHTINITEARNLGTLYCCGVSDRSRSNEMMREKRYKGRPVACHSGPENVP